MPLVAFILRAFSSNLRKASATSGERAALEATAIHEPTIQNYLAWRRSLVVLVVVATFLSAALVTYCDLTETTDRPDVFESLSEKFVDGAANALPAEGLKDSLAEVKDALPIEDLKEAVDDAVRAEEVKDAVEKAKDALPAVREMADSDDESAAGRSAADRGSSDAPDSAGPKDDDQKPETAFGKFADTVHLVSLYALPVAALAVVFCWTRLQFSFRILLAGFAFSFFVPMILALCPWSWWGHVEPNVSPAKNPNQYYQLMAEGIVEGAEYLITLLPTVLSLVPGLQRACLRVKTLVPESTLPGWFLVAAAPFNTLMLLVIFIAVNQVASDPLFLVGMLLCLAAPVLFLVRSQVFTGPLTSDGDFKRMRRVQSAVGAITMVGGVLLVIFITTRDVFGIHVIGLDPKKALLSPVDLVGYLLEFAGRSLFMTALGADLVMRMNLTNWKNSRAFAGSPAAEGYDRVMGALEQAAK